MRNFHIKQILLFSLIINSAELQAAALPFGRLVDTQLIALQGETIAAQAVPKEKFIEGLKSDCRDFHMRLQKWSDQKVRISDEVYREMRSLPSSFSMLENFEVAVQIPKTTSASPNQIEADGFSFSVSTESPQVVFGPKSFTPEQYRSQVKNEVVIQVNSSFGEPVAIFQARDVFCDVLFGHAKLNVSGELFMHPEQNFKKSLKEKLKPYADAFNLTFKKEMSESMRAVLFGAALYGFQGGGDLNKFQNEAVLNSDLYLQSGRLKPHDIWFFTQDKKFEVRDLSQIYLGTQKIQFIIGN